jgi:hypothetical protein
VVIGGLTLSTIFTLFLVPALFSLAADAQTGFRGAFGGGTAASGEPA